MRRRGRWTTTALLSALLFLLVMAVPAAALLPAIEVHDVVEETVEAVVGTTSDTARRTTELLHDTVHPAPDEPAEGAEVTDRPVVPDGQPVSPPPAATSPTVPDAPDPSGEQAPLSTVRDGGTDRATVQADPGAHDRPAAAPPLASAPEEEPADLKAIAQGAVFPLGLVLLVVTFLAVQDHIDRRDPKLALAPVQASPDLVFPAPKDHESG